jgi:CMP-N-acetylneuraminic acid synthetase
MDVIGNMFLRKEGGDCLPKNSEPIFNDLFEIQWLEKNLNGDPEAVIPARKNSQGIKSKNLVNLGGKPLIQWTLEVAQESGIFDQVVVTSDDSEILKMSRRFGADPIEEFEKPAIWNAHVFGAVMYALEQVKASDADNVFLLLPTSPLRKAEHLISASLLLPSGTSVIGVTQTCPYYSLRQINETNVLTQMEGEIPTNSAPTLPKLNFTRDQYGKLYRVNGAMFASTYANLLRYETFHSPQAIPLIMEALYSVDINTSWDLAMAEALLQCRK